MGVCRVRALLSAPLPRVWEFIIDPRNMHLWGPLAEPVTGFDRPLQAGDRFTQQRKGFFRKETQELLVEEVIPYRSFHLRVLSPRGSRLSGTATVNVEEAADPGTTWIEEVISYSLGDGPVIQWLDRWLLCPLLGVVVRLKSKKAFRRLGKQLAR
jgi:hypothetical protein